MSAFARKKCCNFTLHIQQRKDPKVIIRKRAYRDSITLDSKNKLICLILRKLVTFSYLICDDHYPRYSVNTPTFRLISPAFKRGSTVIR